MMKTISLRYTIGVLVCLVLPNLYGQEKFDEKLVQISQMTSYQAVYQLEQYQQDFPKFSGVYYHLGKLSEEQIPTIHPILNYQHLRRTLYNTRLFYGNCMHFAKDASLKNEHYLGLPIKGKHVEYTDIVRYAREKMKHVSHIQDLVINLYTSYDRMVARYEDCRRIFTQFCEKYPGEKQAHLLLRSDDIVLMNTLANQFDSLQNDIQLFQEALNQYPVDGYHPSFVYSDIRLYRLDGLTRSNFMESTITLWNYGAFAQQFLEEQNNDYAKYYQTIRSEYKLIDDAINQVKRGHKPTLKTNKILTNYINKMDYESFMIPLTHIQQMCGDMIHCYASGLFSVNDTVVDAEEIELALNNVYEKYCTHDTCTHMLEVLRTRISEQEMEKYTSVLGTDNTVLQIEALAQNRLQVADSIYTEISKLFYNTIEPTITPFEKYTDDLTEVVISAGQLTQRGVEVVTILPVSKGYLVVYVDGVMEVMNAQLELLQTLEYPQYAPIKAAYKISGNNIAIVTSERIHWIGGL